MISIISRFRLPVLVLVVMLQLALVFSPIAYAAKDPAVPQDFCSQADDTPFCKDKLDNPPGGDPIDNDSSPILGPSSIFYKIIQTVIILTGSISVIMIMVGGFRYVVSGGDSTAVKSAKDTILYALVGLIIAIFAQTIITFVLSNI